MTQDGPLRVAMLAAEASPFAKVGGLGDVVGALPKALEKLGVKPIVIIPAYRAVHSNALNIRPCSRVSGFDIPMKSAVERAAIFQSRIEGTGVDVYLIGSRKYFDRPGIYDDPDTRDGYSDNTERFIFFMKSALELLQRLGEPIHIIHCHDSHTALVPGLIQTNLRNHPFFSKNGTLFTIHNLAYQGICSNESLAYAGIDAAHFYPNSPFEYWGQVNFMKAGIEFADKVNTVSHTYSVEIQTNPEQGMGLEGVLQRRKGDVSGIVNGIDYDEWNPQTDPFIPAHFSIQDLTGKTECRQQLQQYLRLPVSAARVPLIGIVARLTDQKGFELLAEAIHEVMALNLQLVVLGTGQQKYHDLFEEIAAKYSGKLAVQLSFDNGLAHRIEAGCDMFLMPSKFEPCGLNQLYSLRYGTVPIVHATGGLVDTVAPYDSDNGTGFRFSNYSVEGMMAAIKQALAVYSDPARWHALRIRGMSQDWSWSRSAAQYLQLYRSIYLKRNPES
jgi:starch synthase